MSDVNQEYLIEQFELVEEFLRRARGIAARSQEDYLSDSYAIDASVRELTVLFETCHNIAKHLIARHGWRAPILQDHLTDFERFLSLVARWLGGEPETSSPT